MERQIARGVYDLPDWTTPVFEVVMQTGTRAAIVVVAVVALVAGRRHLALQLTLAGASAWLVAWVLKRVVDRARPTLATLDRAPRDVADGFGFPSTHAAIAAALATIVVLYGVGGRAVAAVAVAAAVLTAVARVHIGVHWPLDVLGGAAIGAAAGFGVRRALPVSDGGASS